MDILVALKQEEPKLQGQLKAIQTAITALNGGRVASEMIIERLPADFAPHPGVDILPPGKLRLRGQKSIAH